jgi:plastocyanin
MKLPIVSLVMVVATVLLLDSRFEAAQGSGRIAGTVRLTTVSGGRSSSSAYPSRKVGPRATPLPEARNVIVFLDGVKALVDLKAMHAEIAQEDEQFTPHVVAVTAGSTVDFPNRDTFFHNVFSLSRPKTFDLGRYPSGATRSERFLKPGLVKVYCHIHSQMSAVIRVFDHSFFTIPDDKGAFVLEGIPAGEFTIVAWHERIGERRDKITIKPGATTNITFTLPVLEPGQ